MLSWPLPVLVPPSALGVAFLIGLAWLQLRPVPGAAVAAVFAPGMRASTALAQMAAAPSAWRVLRVLHDGGLPVLLLRPIGPAAPHPTDLHLPGLLLLINLTGAAGCPQIRKNRS